MFPGIGVESWPLRFLPKYLASMVVHFRSLIANDDYHKFHFDALTWCCPLVTVCVYDGIYALQH